MAENNNTELTLLIFSPKFRILKANIKAKDRVLYRYVDAIYPERSSFTLTYAEALDLAHKHHAGIPYMVINEEPISTLPEEMRGAK